MTLHVLRYTSLIRLNAHRKTHLPYHMSKINVNNQCILLRECNDKTYADDFLLGKMIPPFWASTMSNDSHNVPVPKVINHFIACIRDEVKIPFL